MRQPPGRNCATPSDAPYSFTGFCRRAWATDPLADGWDIGHFEGHGLRTLIDHHNAPTRPQGRILAKLPNQKQEHPRPRRQVSHRLGWRKKTPSRCSARIGFGLWCLSIEHRVTQQ